MKDSGLCLRLLVAAGLLAFFQPSPQLLAQGFPRVYIEPHNGFESYIAAAIVKKRVPVVVTRSKEDAHYYLTSDVVEKEESAGSKIARCLFAYCIGMQGTQSATVQLIDAKRNEVAWAYNVRKGSTTAYQSTAEAIAKHLKRFLERNPR